MSFPEVPPPDDPLSPPLLASRWVSGDLRGDDMPGIAADLLEAHYDSQSLRRLAGEMEASNSAGLEPLVGAMFKELGVNYPMSEREAKIIVSRQIAREVIAGTRNPWGALQVVLRPHHTPPPGYFSFPKLPPELQMR